MLDTMAERYGQLPSTIISQATTFDLFICDTALGYRNSKEAAARGDKPARPEVSEKDMLAAMARVKKDGNGKNKSK